MALDYYRWPPALGSKPPPIVNTVESLGDTRPHHYIPAPGLVDAVNVALLLGMPLLVTGEPGTGKSELARSISYQLGLDWQDLPTFVAKSTSEARDLFYTYDPIGRLQAAEFLRLTIRDAPNGAADGTLLQSLDARNFIRLAALGQAILAAIDVEQTRFFCDAGLVNSGVSAGPRRSVVLIDEIDKAPRDFVNDLLDELENMRFRIPELGNVQTPPLPPALRPVVIITSNSERQLPDAFLRRCLYFNIPFPPSRANAPTPDDGPGYFIEDILIERLASHWRTNATAIRSSSLLNQAIAFFYHLRGLQPALLKRPSTAELLNWVIALRAIDPSPDRDLLHHREKVCGTLVAIAKSPPDLDRAVHELMNWQHVSEA